MTMSEEEHGEGSRYTIEYAKSGRSRCSRTKDIIAKDELRIGDSGVGEFTAWFSVGGFFDMMDRKKDDAKKIHDVEELRFLPRCGKNGDVEIAELDEADRAVLERKVEELHDPSERAKREEKRKADAAGKRAEKKRAAAAVENGIAAKKSRTEASAKALEPQVISGDNWKQRAISEVLKLAPQVGARLSANEKEAKMKVLQQIMIERVNDSVDVAVVVQALMPKSSARGKAAGCEQNQGLIDALTELGKYEIDGGDVYKGRAYTKAAAALAELSDAVTSGELLSKGKTKVPGIGKAIAAKIDEFLENGSISKLEEFRNA